MFRGETLTASLLTFLITFEDNMLFKDFDVYVDSDGVVVDFDSYCVQHFGKPVEAFDPKSRFWQAVDHHDKNVQKFFRHMPKMADADVLLDFLVANFRSVKILTACGYTPKDAKEQKIEWYAEHYPSIECIVVPKSPDKAAYAKPDAFLIDDRSKSIDPWIAAGGRGILHKSAGKTIAELMSLVKE